MIRPTKYLDLGSCVLRIASTILSELMESKVVDLHELENTIQSKLGDSARFNFLPTLSFLFILGKINYDTTNDVIIFTESSGE